MTQSHSWLISSARVLLAVFAVLLIVGSSLAGCIRWPVPENVPPPDIVVAVPEGSAAEALRAVADIYQIETGQVVHVQSPSAASYLRNLEGYLLAGHQAIDLAYLPASRVPRWVNYRGLQPVANLAESSKSTTEINDLDLELLRPWLTSLTYSHQLYGFPTQPAVEGLWYRADWLAAAGLQPPDSWEAFRAAAEVLAQAPARHGLALAAAESGPASEFSALLAGFGGQYFFAPQGEPPVIELALEQPETQRAFAFYAGLWGGSPLAQPGSLSAGRAGAAAALREGRAAMAILPLTLAAPLLDCKVSPQTCSSPESGPAETLLAFAALPGLPRSVAVGELGAWVIPLHSAHAQAARAFGAWLVSPAGARAWALNGGIPADSVLAGNLPADPQLAEKAPYLALLAGVQDYRLPYPAVTTGEQVEVVLSAGVQAVSAGRLGPVEAAGEIAAGLRRALHQGGYTVK